MVPKKAEVITNDRKKKHKKRRHGNQARPVLFGGEKNGKGRLGLMVRGGSTAGKEGPPRPAGPAGDIRKNKRIKKSPEI